MNEVPNWKISKWPFLLANVALLAVAAAVVYKAQHPISQTEILSATACVALGAVFGCLPFLLDYRATGKIIEVHAVGEVTGKIQDLKRLAAQVATATDQWANVQQTTRNHAEKTTVAAREIAERMETEVREFNEFQTQLNDTEKAALRLEVEKLKRTEGEWLQVVARILDNIHALHTAAVRTGQADLAEQIGQFQSACRDVARRVGVTQLEAPAGSPFDAERQRAHGVENPPADAIVAETLAPGFSYQGRPIRPVLVRLQTAAAFTPEPAPETSTPTTETAEGQLPL
jgi:molecular chaperone GrpE (heat shock protein)